MVAPALIIVAMLGIYPVLSSLRMSFVQYDLLRVNTEGTPFVGLKNFQTIFADPRFVQTLTNTLVFVVIIVGTVIFIGVMIAQVLNMNFPGRGTFRSIVLVPWVTPPVVAAAIWLWMFQTERSPINQLLRAVGLIDSNIRFLTDASLTWGPVSIPMLSVSAVRVWIGLPFVTVMILAALQSIPMEIYEAAEIDGATTPDKFRFITLPLLRPVLTILATLLVISGIGHFEVNYVMTAGGPRDLTNVLAVLAYQQAFLFYRFDIAAAMSSVILLMTGTIAIGYIWVRLREMA
jgi:multiple sugar transport system permease protein